LKGFYFYKKKMRVTLILRPGFIDFELGEKEEERGKERVGEERGERGRERKRERESEEEERGVEGENEREREGKRERGREREREEGGGRGWGWGGVVGSCVLCIFVCTQNFL
jgi:hypothetical protein